MKTTHKIIIGFSMVAIALVIAIVIKRRKPKPSGCVGCGNNAAPPPPVGYTPTMTSDKTMGGSMVGFTTGDLQTDIAIAPEARRGSGHF